MVTVLSFNFGCAVLQYTALYTLKRKTLEPEKLPLIEKINSKNFDLPVHMYSLL